MSSVDWLTSSIALGSCIVHNVSSSEEGGVVVGVCSGSGGKDGIGGVGAGVGTGAGLGVGVELVGGLV